MAMTTSAERATDGRRFELRSPRWQEMLRIFDCLEASDSRRIVVMTLRDLTGLPMTAAHAL
jgi:hypothetical protein